VNDTKITQVTQAAANTPRSQRKRKSKKTAPVLLAAAVLKKWLSLIRKLWCNVFTVSSIHDFHVFSQEVDASLVTSSPFVADEVEAPCSDCEEKRKTRELRRKGVYCRL
jgi:hypothetical protein